MQPRPAGAIGSCCSKELQNWKSCTRRKNCDGSVGRVRLCPCLHRTYSHRALAPCRNALKTSSCATSLVLSSRRRSRSALLCGIIHATSPQTPVHPSGVRAAPRGGRGWFFLVVPLTVRVADVFGALSLIGYYFHESKFFGGACQACGERRKLTSLPGRHGHVTMVRHTV